MRLMDNYAYANPFLEPASLDALLVPDPDDDQVLTHTIADPAADVERDLEAGELHLAVSRFVGGLGPEDRELIHRVFWHGDTQSQVALDFQVSGAAISKRMSRIQALGRKALAAHQHSRFLQ